VGVRMLKDVRQQLASHGVGLVCCHGGRVGKALAAAGFEPDALFPSEDAALESCENHVLAEVMPDRWLDPPPVSLSTCVLFSNCDDAELQLLDERMATKSFTAGETIIHTGTNADELFVLIAGNVEVRLRLDGKNHQRLDVFSGGMSFGEISFLDGSPRSADVVAMSDVQCRVIDRPLFDALGAQFPVLKGRILHEIALQLCDRLRHANIEISALRS